MKLKNILLDFIKGFAIGGSLLVPGVSGGTMAIIVDIYDKLIASVAKFFEDKKRNFMFLLIFCVGAGLGILLIAKPLLYLIETYELPVMYFFIGVVIGAIPLMLKKAKVNKFKLSTIIYPIIGVLIVLSISLLPQSNFDASTNPYIIDFFVLVLSGVVIAIALVLPGISMSFMLLLLGVYDITLEAITTFDLPFLLPLAIGLLLGIILTTKLIERLLENHTTGTYLIILGFIVGSIIEIFPGAPTGANMLICPLTFVLGIGIILLLSRLELKR